MKHRGFDRRFFLSFLADVCAMFEFTSTRTNTEKSPSGQVCSGVYTETRCRMKDAAHVRLFLFRFLFYCLTISIKVSLC